MRSRHKGDFVKSLPQGARTLDVGCGNNSPAIFKFWRPDLYYVGIDVGDYNQVVDPGIHANEYVVCAPAEFSATIGRYKGQMDAVVSSHNLEHCDDPDATLAAMVSALRPGGMLYLSFPCEASVNFPRRGGCLNFFDDNTHQRVPSWQGTLDTLVSHGCRIEFSTKRHRPFPLWLKGLLYEPLSMVRRQTMSDGSTWALYGFESIIWAQAAR